MQDFKEFFNRNKTEILYSFGALFLLGVLFSGVCLLLSSEKKESPPPPPQTEQLDISISDALDAMSRGHPNAQSVCFDSGDGYFVKYGKPIDDKHFDEGWYFVHHKIFRTSVGKVFVQEISSEEYVRVFPDVTGLECKDINK